MALPPVAPAGAHAWRINSLIELHWRDWGEDSIVMEARSGQLFQFDPLWAAIMACFEEGVYSVAMVAEALATDLGCTADDEFLETVSTAMQEFQRMGWLEPIME